MGKLDSLLNAFKMNNDDEDEEFEDFEDYDEFEPAPKTSRRGESSSDNQESEKKRGSFLASMAPRNSGSRKGQPMNNMEVCVIKPVAFEEALQIADALLEGRSVVLNLEGINNQLAQRIVDFVTGACYSLKAHFESISKFVFVITPEPVDITGATQNSGLGVSKDFQS